MCRSYKRRLKSAGIVVYTLITENVTDNIYGNVNGKNIFICFRRENMKKKVLSALLVASMVATMFTGCGDKKEAKGKVYYLNFKPEADAQWQELAKKYTDETGVEVKVVTAAEGTYEETLTSEIDKKDAPTLFQINGSVGYQSWKDYCLDLKDSKVYGELTNDDFAVKSGDGVYGVAYVYEGYGIVVNKKLLEQAGHKLDEIKDFNSLKAVAEDITAKKDSLGFAAFASAGLDGSSSWRFSGHLTNLPLYYEFKDDNVTEQPATVKGTYLAQYQNVWDLYTKNATCDPADLASKTMDDSTAEFKDGKAVFYQNGTWCYNDVKALGDENLAYIPIYFGVNDAEQGLCCGTENFWSVNSQSSKEDQQATLDFMYWVATSDAGTSALADEMGFVAPFKKAKAVQNVLANQMNEYITSGKENVNWVFSFTPNTESWRTPIVSALANYSAGKEWSEVEKAYVDGWAEQYKLQQQ